MPTRRQRRLNALLHEELLLLVPGRFSDPRLVDAQVTRVETTQDMSTAKVYVTARGYGEDEVAVMIDALTHAAGFLRRELASLDLRRVPALVFAWDRVFESGERVLDILASLEPEVGPEALDDAPGDEPESPASAADGLSRSEEDDNAPPRG